MPILRKRPTVGSQAHQHFYADIDLDFILSLDEADPLPGFDADDLNVERTQGSGSILPEGTCQMIEERALPLCSQHAKPNMTTPMHENKDALDQDLPEFDRQLSIQLIRTIDDGIQIDAHNVPRGPLIALSVRTSEFVTKQTQKSSRKSETRPARIKPPTAKRQSCGRISTEAIRAVMELCGK